MCFAAFFDETIMGVEPFAKFYHGFSHILHFASSACNAVYEIGAFAIYIAFSLVFTTTEGARDAS